MMTRKAFSFALPMVLLAAACSDNSDTPPDPDATMTVEPDGGIGDCASDCMFYRGHTRRNTMPLPQLLVLSIRSDIQYSSPMTYMENQLLI